MPTLQELETTSSVRTSAWYVLWAPAGFGGTVARLGDIRKVLREFDPDAVLWYPLYPVEVRSRLYMKAVYAGYAFVKCKWSPGLEDAFEEEIPVMMSFIKDPDTLLPIAIPESSIEIVKAVVDELVKKPELYQPPIFKIGDYVRVLRRSFYGQIGVVASEPNRGRIAVELTLFRRIVPVMIALKDLQAV